MTISKAKLIEPTANSYSRKPHTLVIDDDKAVADTLAMVLNTDGFGARAVYSGEAGVALARTLDFDFLVTGVVMPQINALMPRFRSASFFPSAKPPGLRRQRHHRLASRCSGSRLHIRGARQAGASSRALPGSSLDPT